MRHDRRAMSLVELGRFARNEAHIVIGRLEAEGIPAFAFDGNAFFVHVRVMVDDDDLAAARAIVTALPDS